MELEKRQDSPFEEAGQRLPPTPPDYDSPIPGSEPFPLPSKSTTPLEVLDIDKKTPDAHVPRDPRLIRLTGVHPFNVEAPLTDLFNDGFLTSTELFYVRNHGHVPKVEDEAALDWEFSIEGLVQNPITLTLRNLIQDFDNVTCPITLVCAGNRRKEQNVVRKTKGFSWGAAGLSTALFTGVALSDVIRRARPLRGAKYVCMEGADKLPNGCYGTSIKLNWVMDPNRGIMLAHGMNGEPLRPDHGKPLRAVVPGQIGGRSVKWLKKLILTSEPSDNWYHIYDNRVLPTMVSPEESVSNPSWWKDERYAIYDLSTNSAVACPAHDERLQTSDSESRDYCVRGYAYTGGGRRISRVEISIDQGQTWQLANIDYPEEQYRDARAQSLYGGLLDFGYRESSFCWCFWDLRVPVADLANAKDVLVRAMDDSMNLQPRDMYWSVLGMMNNPWYRLAIIKDGNDLRFEHPTQPAQKPGGWMERVKNAGGDLTNGTWGETKAGEVSIRPATKLTEVIMTNPDIKKSIGIEELRKHDKEDNPWFIVNGDVFDGTHFLEDHPGGAQSIVSAAGLDVTEEFMAIHSETAKAMMPKHHVGTLDEAARLALKEDSSVSSDVATRPVFLDSRQWLSAKLHSKKTVSWDTRIFTFKLARDDQTFGLPVGKHVMIRLQDPTTKETIIRSYTPLSEINQQGYVDILIKVYMATKEKPGGRMTQVLDTWPIGGTIDFKGPIGKFEYLGSGLCSINGIKKTVTKFIMICGGSGITPIFQVLRAAMQNQEDSTRCVVLYGNRLLEDILCKEQLDEFADTCTQRCQILHTLTQAPDHWTGLKGRISIPLLQEHAIRDENTMVLICGPEAMEKSVHKILLEVGWKEDELVFF